MPPLVRDVLGLGPLGYVLLATPPVAAVLAAVGIAAPNPAGRVAARSALGVFAVSLVSAWALVGGARMHLLRVLDHAEEPYSAAYGMSFGSTWHLWRALVAEEAAAWSALLLVPLIDAALSVSAARAAADVRERLLACAWGVGLGLPAWCAAWVLVRASADFRGTRYGELVSPRDKFDLILASFDGLAAGRPLVLFAGILGAILVIGAAIVSRRAASWHARAMALAIGVVGLAAYVATRSAAYDAAHPLPYVDQPTWTSAPPSSALPAAPRDCQDVAAPLVALTDGGIVIDGVGVTTTDDAYAMLKSKRELWEQIHPGKDFPGVVAFAAPATLSTDDVLRVLETARRAGFLHPLAVAALPPASLESRTLGLRAMTPRMCLAAVLPGEGGTWGDHVRNP